MDRNTIIGIILIFVIFIGFGVYNSSQTNKAFTKTVAIAESDYAKGDLESARTDYTNALRLKPNQPDVLLKLNEINTKLGNTPAKEKADSLGLSQSNSAVSGVASAVVNTDANQYGVFAEAATGKNDFITLENNLVELKIALKGGRVYSARLKKYKTFDAQPLVLFSGDSTVFGFNFFTS
jgi:YidC/Oxa1 family membrane protein insertase